LPLIYYLQSPTAAAAAVDSTDAAIDAGFRDGMQASNKTMFYHQCAHLVENLI